MPSSRPEHIPIVLRLVQQLAPESILDVGVGFGKWGHLFREYTDIRASETEPPRYARENWRTRIDGIEGHAAYLTPAHRFFYDRLYLGDMRTTIHGTDIYDLVFLGDVIEHVEKHEGRDLLRACLAHARKAVIVTTPASDTPQAAVCGNPLEVHRSAWRATDFAALAPTCTHVDDNDTLIAVLLRDGVPAPVFGPRPRRRRRPSPAWNFARRLWPGAFRSPASS